MNYDSELQSVLVDQLKKQYGIQDEVVLFIYFQLRYQIWKLTQEPNMYLKDICYQVQFLISELNLPVERGRFKYKDEWILSGFSLENSLQSIMEEWNVRHFLKTFITDKGINYPVYSYIGDEWKKLLHRSENKAKSFKHSSDYLYHLQKYALDDLNQMFMAYSSPPSYIDYIEYPANYNPFARTLEEVVEAMTHASNLLRYDTSTIKEEDVERFLCQHLELIEEGLRLIERQYPIKDGRLDILAKDKTDTFVIIECKTDEQDKDLVWQSIYYPMQLKREKGLQHVRMITISPHYPFPIKTSLQFLRYVEMFVYTPVVNLGKITSLEVSKIKSNLSPVTKAG